MPLNCRAPRVSVGQVVLWSYGPNEKPSPAIVTAVGQGGTINCLCHVDSIKDHVGKTGVRHKDDPFLRAHPAHDAGVWQLTGRDEAIDTLLDLGEERVRSLLDVAAVARDLRLVPGFDPASCVHGLPVDGEDD